jgi:hypothetical protein
VNEALFIPTETGKAPDYGSIWRLVPVTVLLALGLAGLEKATPEFAVGLSKLLLVGVLFFPVGNAQSPIVTAAKLVGAKTS